MKKILYMFAITALVLGMASCGDEPQIQSVYNPNSEKGMMPGKFTVDAEGTQVQFSKAICSTMPIWERKELGGLLRINGIRSARSLMN